MSKTDEFVVATEDKGARPVNRAELATALAQLSRRSSDQELASLNALLDGEE